jgi:hypothetical protein
MCPPYSGHHQLSKPSPVQTYAIKAFGCFEHSIASSNGCDRMGPSRTSAPQKPTLVPQMVIVILIIDDLLEQAASPACYCSFKYSGTTGSVLTRRHDYNQALALRFHLSG